MACSNEEQGIRIGWGFFAVLADVDVRGDKNDVSCSIHSSMMIMAASNVLCLVSCERLIVRRGDESYESNDISRSRQCQYEM
jgi:hypothetical protein